MGGEMLGRAESGVTSSPRGGGDRIKEERAN